MSARSAIKSSAAYRGWGAILYNRQNRGIFGNAFPTMHLTIHQFPIHQTD